MSIFNLGVLGGIVSLPVKNPKKNIHTLTLFPELGKSHRYERILKPITIILNNLAGSIIQYGSYRIAMYAMGGAFIIMFLLVFFFMPETAYHRDNTMNIDTSVHTLNISEKHKEQSVERIENNAHQTSPSSEPRDSYKKTLQFWSGYKDDVSFWRTLIRPFVMIASPVVMWATLLFTICISWLVLISITLSQIFSAPPYNFSISAVGATNMSSFVASVLATLIAGPIIDGVAKLMSKHNNGIFGMYLANAKEKGFW